MGILSSLGNRLLSLQGRLEHFRYFGERSGASSSEAPTLPVRPAMIEGVCYSCRRPSGSGKGTVSLVSTCSVCSCVLCARCAAVPTCPGCVFSEKENVGRVPEALLDVAAICIISSI